MKGRQSLLAPRAVDPWEDITCCALF